VDGYAYVYFLASTRATVYFYDPFNAHLLQFKLKLRHSETAQNTHFHDVHVLITGRRDPTRETEAS